MKYIAYCRKSTDEPDRQILSIEAQIAEVKEFAQREGLEIVEFITESKTAKKFLEWANEDATKEKQKLSLQGKIKEISEQGSKWLELLFNGSAAVRMFQKRRI